MPTTPDLPPTASGCGEGVPIRDHLPLYRRGTTEAIGHLGEPVHISKLTPGDVVWDDLNDQEAVFEGWFASWGCYLLYWPRLGPEDGGFCAWDLDGTARPHMWRHVVIHDHHDTTTADTASSTVDGSGSAPSAGPAPGKRTWTFLGHWDNDRIVIDDIVDGQVDDPRPDVGQYEQGLWAAAGTGRTIAEAQRDARADYES